MDSSLNTLAVLAEVTTGFVAFSAIVATLRVSFGEQLSAFQVLLVQFFTVNGMLTVSIVLMPLVISEFWQDERTVALYSIIYILVSGGTYLVYYIRERLRIEAPTPLASVLVIIGYAVFLTLHTTIVTGLYWEANLGIIVATGYWGLFSSVIIFVSFLAEFVRPGKTST